MKLRTIINISAGVPLSRGYRVSHSEPGQTMRAHVFGYVLIGKIWCTGGAGSERSKGTMRTWFPGVFGVLVVILFAGCGSIRASELPVVVKRTQVHMGTRRLLRTKRLLRLLSRRGFMKSSDWSSFSVPGSRRVNYLRSMRRQGGSLCQSVPKRWNWFCVRLKWLP